VFENKVLRRIFGPKTEEEAGGWKILDNEELHNLYASPLTKGEQVKKDESGGACSMHGGDEKCMHNFGRKT
jgi:hypothetical protein